MVRTDDAPDTRPPHDGSAPDRGRATKVPLWKQQVSDHGASASPRMFESDLVDAFSRVPYWIVPLVYVPVISASCYAAVAVEGLSVPGLALTFSLGWVAWTLMEYWLHRTLFHWVPPVSWGEQFHFVLHGVHHDWYRDRLRLVMPPAASLAVGAVMFGYLAYDMIHYYVHHGKPTTRVMLALRSHHSKHHHNPRFQEKKYGVSTTVWDHVFGTYE